MKNLKSISALFLMLVFATGAFAQGNDTLKIKTSAECGMCKKTIEKELAYVKGVKKANLDVESKVVTVIYNPKKTSPEKIKAAIAKCGYDADDVKAEGKAYEKLPDCCKKGGMEGH